MAEGTARAFALLCRLQSVGLYEFAKFSPELRRALENDIGELCSIFSASDPGTRAEIAKRVSDSFAFAFLWFAKIAAEEAVRESSAEAIWFGLMALLIENFHRDYRDNLYRLVLLYHSSTKLGLDAQDLFAKASDLAVSHLAAQLVRDFPLRSPGTRSLGSFLYEETGTGESFAYRKLGDDAPF